MMDDRQFDFICCPSKEKPGDPLAKFMSSLAIPDGYTVGQLLPRGEFTLAQGYNLAMSNSKARYKIYLNQTVTILNHRFLQDILALFQAHPNLGLLGVLGAKTLPANGNWRESPDRYGKIVYNGNFIDYQREIANDFEPVLAVDGMIMITQYDLPWRQEMFADFFLDTAQCLEFIKAGYTVGIPQQREPWCSYDNPSDSIFEYYRDREAFVGEYRSLIAAGIRADLDVARE